MVLCSTTSEVNARLNSSLLLSLSILVWRPSLRIKYMALLMAPCAAAFVGGAPPPPIPAVAKPSK
eukprot:8776967-Pyramimonas_sp.AAC.1